MLYEREGGGMEGVGGCWREKGRVERPMESKVGRRETSHSIVEEGTSASTYLFSQTLICEVVLT